MPHRRRPTTPLALLAVLLAATTTAAAGGGDVVLPERPAVDRRASPLGPLVTDFRAPARPAEGRLCNRCARVHGAHAACVGAAKAAAGWLEPPYHDWNGLYGYQDYAWGRGPVIPLGDRAMNPGFRGYGLLGSPGYGAGIRPTSAVDLEVLGGHWYPEARRLWPRWSHWPK
jgi:hypothetical protein